MILKIQGRKAYLGKAKIQQFTKEKFDTFNYMKKLKFHSAKKENINKTKR